MANHKNLIGFTKLAEGGLSRTKSDSASANPSGCLITYKGQTASDWHTNKGITWTTFKASSNVGYQPSCPNFEKMPEDIWLKIFKQKYWDKFYLDEYKSQAIADMIVSWSWGSGVGGAYRQLAKFLNANYGTNYPTGVSDYSSDRAKSMRDKFNELSGKDEREVYDKLVEAKKQFLISLNQPQNLTGWLSRLDKLYQYSIGSIGKVAKTGVDFVVKNWVWVTILCVGVGGLTFALLSIKSKKSS